jgi:hypothetical protein
MTIVAPLSMEPPIRFDFAFLRKGAVYFAIMMLVVAPFSYDPFATVFCGIVPWVLISLVDRPGMPAVAVYYLLWQWLQAAVRLLLAFIDGESIGDGIYGWDVYRAFLYSMASLAVLALAFRVALSGVRLPTDDKLDEHLDWLPSSLFWLFLAASVLSAAASFAAALSPSLAQPLAAVGALKYAVLFVLFATVVSTSNGSKWLVAAVAIEVVLGFGGFFSDFKEVFIVLVLAALAVRVTLRLRNMIGGIATIATMLLLGLFWTAVKVEYRGVVSGYSGAQVVTVAVAERAGLLLHKAVNPGEIDWGLAIDGLLRRIAYIDFFGAVIGYTEVASEPESFGRWRDALEHIAKPRAFFPDKAVLDDTEVFMRYVYSDATDSLHLGTSISIGYLAENFIDFGFPGMLFPVAAMGLLLGGMLRYFMTRSVAWMLREGFATALVLALVTGMELSLAKFLGGTVLVFVVLAFFLKFLFPIVARWIKR